jgi:hypothetical protein
MIPITREQAIKQWKELGVKYSEMNFVCGGDEMQDYDFVYYNADNEEIDPGKDLEEYIRKEVFEKVNFYEVSDGHYIGEDGIVKVTLDESEESFYYDKKAEAEYNERISTEIYVPLSNEEVNLLSTKVRGMRADSLERHSYYDDEIHTVYTKDCVLTDEDLKLCESIISKCDTAAKNYDDWDSLAEKIDYLDLNYMDNISWEFTELPSETGLYLTIRREAYVTRDSITY